MAFSVLSTINKQIGTFLSEKNIEFRRDAGAGVWLSLLLPLSVILGKIQYECSTSYLGAFCISCSLLLHSATVMFRAYYHKRADAEAIFLPSVVSTVLLYLYTPDGLFMSALYSFSSVFIYHNIILPVMKYFPRSFTYGECTVVCQGLVLFIFSALIRESESNLSNVTVATIIIQYGNICLLVIAATAYYYQLVNKPKEFYGLVGSIFAFVLIPSLYFVIGENPLVWIFNLMFEDLISVRLFIFWAVCLFMGAVVVLWKSWSEEKATTAFRKIFHGLAILVFLPGIMFKPCIVYLSSGVIFAIFIALDMVRLLKMPPFGEILQLGFAKLADEKDEGPISATPIYLLVGFSLPLWIHPNFDNSELLPLLAGVLSVGIGDSAASICGSLVGKNKWPGSKKTKEGTAACFLSQLFVVILLIHIGYVPRTNLIRPTFAIAASSLLEAKTDQVDNLALPLITYVMML